MTFNDLLIVTVLLFCFAFALRLVRISWRQNRGWILISGGIFTLTAGLFFWAEQWAGWVGGGLWLIFIVLPLMGLRRVNYLIAQQDYRQASQLAAGVSWLHPFDGWRKQPQLLHALWLGQQGQREDALEILNSYAAKTTPMGRYAKTLLYWMGASWGEAKRWFEGFPIGIFTQEPSLIPYYLRSLGEMGDLNGLLQGVAYFEETLKKTGNVETLQLVRMFTLAFCGEVQLVQQIFQASPSWYTPRMAQYWQLTARMVAGQSDMARRQLTRLKPSGGLWLYAIDWRLSQPLAYPIDVLTPASQEILVHLREAVHQELQVQTPLKVSRTQAYVTYGLIGLNLLLFGLQVGWGGSTNLETLYRLGALVPEEVWAGEWWRLLTANFLHFGALHLGMNMLGLYYLGPVIEMTLGKGKFLFCYLLSGIGAMFLVAWVAMVTNAEPQILVGASAAIMGLVGAIAVILIQNWQQEKSPLAAKRLRFVIFVIGLQLMLDLLIPQVSFLAHAFGLILGFFITGILILATRWR